MHATGPHTRDEPTRAGRARDAQARAAREDTRDTRTRGHAHSTPARPWLAPRGPASATHPECLDPKNSTSGGNWLVCALYVPSSGMYGLTVDGVSVTLRRAGASRNPRPILRDVAWM